MLSSSKAFNVDLAQRQLVTSMQTGSYAVTAAWANVGNGYELTIPADGEYTITCQYSSYVSYTTNSENAVETVLAKNGVDMPGTWGRSRKYTGGETLRLGATITLHAPTQAYVAGDVIRLRARRTNTDACSIIYDATYNGFIQAEMSLAYVPSVSLAAWQSYSLTIGGSTTPPTKGTIVVDNAQWRKNGGNMDLLYTYEQSGAGANGSGQYLFPLPAGYTIDTAILPAGTSEHNGICGTFGGRGVGTNYVGYMKVYDTTNLAIITSASGSGTQFVDSGHCNLGNAIVMFSYSASVPIVGW